MQEEQLYASGRPFKPKTDADNIPVKDNCRLTGGAEATMQEIINAIADRVVNRLMDKSELSDWAKQESKPLYTASEVGADTSGSAVQALADAKIYADNTYTQATGYTDLKVAELVNGSQSTLETLNEIADAMQENESVVDALADAIGTKASEVEAQAHYDNTTVHITASERNIWNNKVDRVAGKVLSTNDYTTTEKNKLAEIADKANNYSLPLSSAIVRGGVKIGYAANGRNYPVQLKDEQMYVNVPWTDSINTSNIGSQSVNYANSAGSANSVAWGNVAGRPKLCDAVTIAQTSIKQITINAGSIASVDLPFTVPSNYGALGIIAVNANTASSAITRFLIVNSNVHIELRNITAGQQTITISALVLCKYIAG